MKINIKNLFNIIFIGLLASCTSKNVEKEIVDSTNHLTFSSEVIDSVLIEVVDSLLKGERVCIDKQERIISYLDTIEYRNEISKIFFGKDTITYREGKERYELALYNDIPLKKYTVRNTEFNIESMSLAFDLNMLKICYIKNSDIIIIETAPTNWTGLMMNFSFYQLINLKEKIVIEYIREKK